jgi:LysM repeat protein
MHRAYPFSVGTLILLGLVLVLSGCFREASDGDADPTQREVSLQDVQAQQSLTPRPTVNTATPTETLEPIPLASSPTLDETLIVGGPPAEGDSEAAPDVPPTDAPTQTPADDTDTPQPTLTPTAPPPSPTPTITTVPLSVATMQRPGYADTGISPTPSDTPQPTETVLATPTDVVPIDECVYLVQGGDTILQISRDLDISVEEIYAENPELRLSPDNLRIGQQIRIPGCVSGDDADAGPSDDDGAASADNTPAPEDTTPQPTLDGGFRLHVVQSGDTLFRLATRYDTTVDAIVAANDSLISENTPIFPGDELLIPPSEEE